MTLKVAKLARLTPVGHAVLYAYGDGAPVSATTLVQPPPNTAVVFPVELTTDQAAERAAYYVRQGLTPADGRMMTGEDFAAKTPLSEIRERQAPPDDARLVRTQAVEPAQISPRVYARPGLAGGPHS